MLARRTGGKKESLPLAGLPATLTAAMDAMQRDLLETARARREANSIRGATKEQFLAQLEAGGGFIYSGFCGRNECEMEIKERTKATIRVLPDEEFRSPQVPAACMWCERPSVTEALWARAY
jgi:prolyl-tRNA synthetase